MCAIQIHVSFNYMILCIPYNNWEIFEVQNFQGWLILKFFANKFSRITTLFKLFTTNEGENVNISRLYENPQKQRNYFTSKISQYTVHDEVCVKIATSQLCSELELLNLKD